MISFKNLNSQLTTFNVASNHNPLLPLFPNLGFAPQQPCSTIPVSNFSGVNTSFTPQQSFSPLQVSNVSAVDTSTGSPAHLCNPAFETLPTSLPGGYSGYTPMYLQTDGRLGFYGSIPAGFEHLHNNLFFVNNDCLNLPCSYVPEVVEQAVVSTVDVPASNEVDAAETTNLNPSDDGVMKSQIQFETKTGHFSIIVPKYKLSPQEFLAQFRYTLEAGFEEVLGEFTNLWNKCSVTTTKAGENRIEITWTVEHTLTDFDHVTNEYFRGRLLWKLVRNNPNLHRHMENHKQYAILDQGYAAARSFGNKLLIQAEEGCPEYNRRQQKEYDEKRKQFPDKQFKKPEPKYFNEQEFWNIETNQRFEPKSIENIKNLGIAPLGRALRGADCVGVRIKNTEHIWSMTDLVDDVKEYTIQATMVISTKGPRNQIKGWSIYLKVNEEDIQKVQWIITQKYGIQGNHCFIALDKEDEDKKLTKSTCLPQCEGVVA